MVLYSLDIWPESLEWGGIKKNSLIFKYYHHVSSRIYCEATVLAATSRMFEKYFEHEFGIKSTLYLPQFAEDIFTPTPIIDNNKTVKLVFAGNIGTVQSIETILQAAKLTENVKSLEWHIYGDGSDLERLKELNERMNLTSVTFHGRKPLEEMPEVYSGASAMLVTMQKKDILSYTLPGKVQSYLAAGKPIIGAIDGETMRIIREAECGFCGPAEDSNLLAENVMRFIQSGEKNMMGQNARKYYDAHFSKIKFMEKLQNLFDELCSDGVRK